MICCGALSSSDVTLEQHKVSSSDEVEATSQPVIVNVSATRTTMATIESKTEATTVANSETATADTVEATIETKEESQSQEYNYSEYELDLVARTIYLEAGGCGEYCQWLVGSTILNLADRNGGIENVVTNANTFNVAPYLFSCTPSELSYSVARRVMSGDRDYNVTAFRANYYHSFGEPYTNVDNVYFSCH